MQPTSQDRATLGADAPGGESSSLGGATPQVAASPTRLTTAELAALYARQDQQRTAPREGQAQTADQSPSDTAASDVPPDSPAADAPEAAPESEDAALAASTTADDTEAPPEGEAPPAGDTDLLEELKNSPGKGVQRLLRQNRELRAELARLQQQEGKPPPVVAGGLDEHPELRRLGDEIQRADQLLAFLDEHPEGGELWGMEVAPESVEGLRRVAAERREDLKFNERARRRELAHEAEQRRAQLDQEAQTAYPRMFQANTAENRMAMQVLQGIPSRLVQALRALPEANQLLGDLVAGRAIRQARVVRGNGAANPFGQAAGGDRPAPPRLPVGRGGAATPRQRQTGTAAQLEAARAAYRKSGRVDDLARVQSLGMRLQHEERSAAA